MNKSKIIKELLVEIEKKNYTCEVLGVRSDTSEDFAVRSKDIRAFLNDLLCEDDDESRLLMSVLESAIDKNVRLDIE